MLQPLESEPQQRNLIVGVDRIHRHQYKQEGCLQIQQLDCSNFAAPPSRPKSGDAYYELFSSDLGAVGQTGITARERQTLDILNKMPPRGPHPGTGKEDMKEAPSLLQLIPDIFFDALAYLLPASLLFIGMMTIPSAIGASLVNAYLNLGASFDRLIVILLGVGILYVVGQMLTHFSYDVILRPLIKMADWRDKQGFARSDIEWMADYTFIRHKDAALGLEISKRYARTIMSRNNALVALLLVITSVISAQWIGLTVSGILFVLFLHEAYGEQMFFSRYLREMTKELRNMEAKPKAD
jgi:hypothetical protein